MSATRMWPVVARREFVERARDKGFVISTAITLLILVGVIVISAPFNRGTEFDLGVVGSESRSIGEQVVAASAALDVEVRLVDLGDEATANSAVRDGSVDAALLDAERILVKSDPPAELVGVIQAVSLRMRSEAELEASGLSQQEVFAALNQTPLPVDALEPRDARRQENAAVAFVGVLALYGQLFAYGYWVAAGVVEEKSSRVVEVLLATLRPSQLLRGKILGIGVLGLLQLFLISVVGLVTAQVVGSLEFPAGAIATIGIVLFWFVLGYFFYASLFAVAGSIVTRQEDLQTDDAADARDRGVVLRRDQRGERPDVDARHGRLAAAAIGPAGDADAHRAGGRERRRRPALGSALDRGDDRADPHRDEDLLAGRAPVGPRQDPADAARRAGVGRGSESWSASRP